MSVHDEIKSAGAYAVTLSVIRVGLAIRSDAGLEMKVPPDMLKKPNVQNALLNLVAVMAEERKRDELEYWSPFV